MSVASQVAAITWRAERLRLGNLAPCDRWFVHRTERGWTACPPCYCSGSHVIGRESPAPSFPTHAQAISHADQQARQATLPTARKTAS